MSADNESLMEQFNITREHKIIYVYNQHRYDNLKDAINQARHDANIDIDQQHIKPQQ